MLIIKKIFALITAFSVCVSLSIPVFADARPLVSAGSAVLMYDGEALFEKNADTPMPMASTTKIMTAILALESCPAEAVLEIPPECCGIEGSSMYLKAGERYSRDELITGLLLASGNDAAAALAIMTAGSIEAFVELMNSKAAELGLGGTHFENPSGLPAEGHFSTARDMAKLLEYCMENKRFCEISSQKSAVIKNQYFTNHNKLLTIYNGCIGGKTGYTLAAGRCLVSCCEKNGLRLVCATLSAPDDWNDHTKLYDWAFSVYERRNVTRSSVYVLPVIGGERETVLVRPENDVFLLAERDSDFELVYELPPFVFAPVSALGRAGRLIIKKDGETVADETLYYCESVPVRLEK